MLAFSSCHACIARPASQCESTSLPPDPAIFHNARACSCDAGSASSSIQAISSRESGRDWDQASRVMRRTCGTRLSRLADSCPRDVESFEAELSGGLVPRGGSSEAIHGLLIAAPKTASQPSCVCALSGCDCSYVASVGTRARKHRQAVLQARQTTLTSMSPVREFVCRLMDRL